ncbi:MAG: carbon-phosphorus lyase complex subunit PhnI, partial [Polaromonas sp.]|nr:carbon-phosphorus lyase complex subunit PhnI [Polaromonas sp.]
GFVQHLKLPHYVDFQSELELVRKLRAAHAQEKQAGQGEEHPGQTAATIQKAA